MGNDIIMAWACGVVVSMFDFHRSDRGSNPGRGGKIFIMITTILYCGTIGKSENHLSHVREIGKMEPARKPHRWLSWHDVTNYRDRGLECTSLVQLLITLIYTVIFSETVITVCSAIITV